MTFASGMLASADNNLSTLAVCFVVAALIISPWAWRVVKRTLEAAEAMSERRIAEDRSAEDQEADDEQASDGSERSSSPDKTRLPTVESVIASIDELATLESTVVLSKVSVPMTMSLNGQRLDDHLAQALLSDALDQAGWEIAEIDTKGGDDTDPGDTRVWTCARKPQ